MPRCMMMSLTSVSILATTAVVAADVPNYNTFTLHVRSNLCVNKGGAGSSVFNIPCDTFFNSASPVINDAGAVAVSLTLIEAGDSEGAFVSDDDGAGIVYMSTAFASVSDVDINNIGDVVWEQVFSSENGLWIYDDSADSSARETAAPLGASGWSSPEINDSNEIGFRANFAGDHAYISYSGGSTAVHATEVAIDVGSPYSFLFTPSFNNARQIAGKVRVGGPGQTGGSQPDEIRIFNSDGTSILIAEDDDGDPLSPYTSFDNSVSLTNTGWVAFTASLVAGGRGVFLGNGTTTLTIGTTADPQVSDVEFFGPAAGDGGHVAFRGEDAASLQAIFVGDGTTLVRMIGEHDLVDTDLGTGRIDQNDNSTVFGGAPGINAFGAVVFSATLTPENNNQIEWGSGVYVSGVLGDVDGNLVVNVFDLLEVLANWNTDGPGADIAAPFDVVDIFDLLAVLDNWTS